MRAAICLLAAIALLCGPAEGKKRQKRQRFLATAYSQDGITKRGTPTRVGIAAADRSVLPLGTVIEVTGAGDYSGTYKITDTGDKVSGAHIDIFMPDEDEAKQFGKKTVEVRVLKWGDDKVLPSTPAADSESSADRSSQSGADSSSDSGVDRK